MHYQTEQVEIGSSARVNSNNGRVKFDFEGQVVAAVAWVTGDPEHPVYVKIENSSGGTIVEETNLQDWLPRSGGDYMSSKKPMSFNTKDIMIKLSSNEPISTPYKFEIMFVIDPTYSKID